MTSTNSGGWRRSSLCESGTCLEVDIAGESVRLRESSTPGHEVITTLASWNSWQQQARADGEHAATARIVAALRAEFSKHSDGWEIAGMIERGEFDDVAAGDE